MKYIKIFFIICMFLLTSCGEVEEEVVIVDNVFKQELNEIYSLYNEDKKAFDFVSEDVANRIFTKITEKIKYFNFNIECGNKEQGLVRDNHKKIIGEKILTKIYIEADEENIKKFLTNIINLENRIIVDNVEISSENEKYKLSVDITLCGLLADEKLEKTENLGLLNIEEIEGKTSEKEKIVLRDNDLLMILRPYNTDSATISFGISELNESAYLFYDVNEKIDLFLEVTNENNKYYCKYYGLGNEAIKSEFVPKSDKIFLDILSCSKDSTKDMVGVNLNIINYCEKKVDVKIFDDTSNRVNCTYSGNVEVNN